MICSKVSSVVVLWFLLSVPETLGTGGGLPSPDVSVGHDLTTHGTNVPHLDLSLVRQRLKNIRLLALAMKIRLFVLYKQARESYLK